MRSRKSSDSIAGIQMRAIKIEKLLRIKRLRLAEPFGATLSIFQTIAMLTTITGAPAIYHINAVAGSPLSSWAVMHTIKM